MEANSIIISKIFGYKSQYCAPLYQRPYVWDKENQLVPMWDDIKNVAEKILEGEDDPTPHFLGAIVLEQQKSSVSRPDSRLIIDGQQRLTTLQIILVVIRDIGLLDNTPDIIKNSAESLIFNKDVEDMEDQFKVWPTNADRGIYKEILLSKSIEKFNEEIGTNERYCKRKLALAYLYFYNTINDWINTGPHSSNYKLKVLLNTIEQKLHLVVIEMSKDDDAQTIFETLNARGTPLLPSDLVKNFLFRRAQREKVKQEPLYEKYWKQFEDQDDFWREDIRSGRRFAPRIENFLGYYLTLMKNDEIAMRHLFTEYQEFVKKNSKKSIGWLFKSFKSYADIYFSFQLKTKTDESKEGVFFRRLLIMDTTTLYPFLLGLYNVLDSQSNSDKEKLNILEDLESYLVRRMVCRLTTKNYNRLFLDLLSYLRKTKNYSRKSVREFLLKQEGDSGRWPDDEELKQIWLYEPIYKFMPRPRLRMILYALDSKLHGSKTEIYTLQDNLTVEHIMPQAWQIHWPLPKTNGINSDGRIELTDERNRILHTIGNLTILNNSLNPAISNGTFKRKRGEILKHSALNLNRFLMERNSWDEKAILARGRSLLNVFNKIWSYPI